MANLYVYEIPPIDSWAGWMSEEEYVASLRGEAYDGDITHELASLRATLTKAEELARQQGWEGDRTVGPLFSAIPGRGGDSVSAVLIGWKQSNDGTTYIASPHRLGWLDANWPPIVG